MSLDHETIARAPEVDWPGPASWGQSEWLDDQWKAKYRRAFVAHALGRSGWTSESAEEWASENASRALAHSKGTRPAPEARDE